MNSHKKNGRTASNSWSEISDLYYKLVDLLYGGAPKNRLAAVCQPLEKLLKRLDSKQHSILGQECRALIGEALGDLDAAIRHRKKEIQLRKRLLEITHDPPTEAEKHVLKNHGYSDLADRLDMLAILYHDSGQLRKGVRALWQSREICELHGVKFEGKQLLTDYLRELRPSRSIK